MNKLPIFGGVKLLTAEELPHSILPEHIAIIQRNAIQWAAEFVRDFWNDASRTVNQKTCVTYIADALKHVSEEL